MYIIKNSLKNILRNRGRNILIGIILLGIITSTVVAFSINTTTNNIIDNYKNRFGTEVTISRNMKKVQELMSQGGNSVKFEDITPQQYLQFGESDLVKDTMFSSKMSVISPLTSVDEELADIDTALEVYIDDDGNIVFPSFVLIGNSNLNALEDFKNEQRKIIEEIGRENV